MTDVEKKFWQKVQKYLPILQIVPFVRLIAICNNLSFGKVHENSDIDLFVVTRNGRLFFVRSMVTFLLHILGVRRHGEKVAGRFCLSFFVDEEGADLSKIALKKDIYLAFWVKSLLPVIGDDFIDEFMRKNDWIRNYFEMNERFEVTKNKILIENCFRRFIRNFLRFLFGGKFGDFFERKLKRWQLKRAKEKSNYINNKENILLDNHILKFHIIDRRKEYRNIWFKKYGDSKLTKEKFLQITV